VARELLLWFCGHGLGLWHGLVGKFQARACIVSFCCSLGGCIQVKCDGQQVAGEHVHVQCSVCCSCGTLPGMPFLAPTQRKRY